MTRRIPPTAELRLVVAFCTPWPGAYRRPLHLGVLGVRNCPRCGSTRAVEVGGEQMGEVA